MASISYDVLLEAYVDIMVHAFYIWIGLHVETYVWMIGTCYRGLGIHVWDS
jgi:hypothetical protein